MILSYGERERNMGEKAKARKTGETVGEQTVVWAEKSWLKKET